MMARTYRRALVNVVVSKKSAAMMAWAWERRNVAPVSVVRWGDRVDTGLVQDLPHGRSGDL
jgi:hypothetical protein